MNDEKKAANSIDEISYLFLSQPQDSIAAVKPITPPRQKSVKQGKATLKSICLVGDNNGFQNAFLVVNLSIALARLGMQIVLLDLNDKFSCLNFFLGREIKNEEFNDLDSLLYKGPMGIKLVSLDKKILNSLEDKGVAPEFNARLKKIESEVDLVLVNLPQDKLTGTSSFLASFLKEFLILVAPEKEKMLDAYRNIKFILQENQLAKTGIIVTEIDHMYEIDKVYNKMAQAAEKFLDKELFKYGFLFRLSQDTAFQAQMASYYDADLTACISNIAQIIVLRSTLNESAVVRDNFFNTIKDKLSQTS